jgi:hypothetical protein
MYTKHDFRYKEEAGTVGQFFQFPISDSALTLSLDLK